jgi:uncharacterized lipoprotein NlpE involved in copper resistance
MSDTAETSLDWPGEYKGVFPCADCQGIETELELKADILSGIKTYELKQEYLGKGKNSEFKVKGTFSFDADNPAMISLDQAGENRKFFIGENFVEARDIKSEKLIDSKMNYKLQKDANELPYLNITLNSLKRLKIWLFYLPCFGQSS